MVHFAEFESPEAAEFQKQLRGTVDDFGRVSLPSSTLTTMFMVNSPFGTNATMIA